MKFGRNVQNNKSKKLLTFEVKVQGQNCLIKNLQIVIAICGLRYLTKFGLLTDIGLPELFLASNVTFGKIQDGGHPPF